MTIVPYKVRLALLNKVRRQLQILLAGEYGELIIVASSVIIGAVRIKAEQVVLFFFRYLGTVGIGYLPTHEQAVLSGLRAEIKFPADARNNILAFGRYGTIFAVVACYGDLHLFAEYRH